LAGHVVRYVLENYTSQVTLEQLARGVGLSKYYLIRRFCRMTGITPGAFLKRVRLVKAMDLLVESKLDIKHVAHAVGYTDVAAFCRAFRSATGTAPRLYRLTRREAIPVRPSDGQERGMSNPPTNAAHSAQMAGEGKIAIVGRTGSSAASSGIRNGI
jgi:AraC-like DNA-binding protein